MFNLIVCSYLNRHVVDKLEVVNKKWVRVNLQPGSSVDGSVRNKIRHKMVITILCV